jgi:hypothetical protein
MFELALHEAYFVVRRHAQTSVELKGALRECGSVSTGKVFEQLVVVTDCNGEKLNCRPPCAGRLMLGNRCDIVPAPTCLCFCSTPFGESGQSFDGHESGDEI